MNQEEKGEEMVVKVFGSCLLCWAGEGAHPTLGKVLAECSMTLACRSP